MKRARIMVIAAASMLAALFVFDAVRACGPYLSFRAYLTRSFWLPMFYTFPLITPGVKHGNAPPYAAFSTSAAPAPLERLRQAYRELASQPGAKALDQACDAASRALVPGTLTGPNLEEARLIDCKILLRTAEENPDSLAPARRKLEDFISSAAVPAFAAEARGWLARIFYLQGDYVPAAKIYLDETEAADSPLSRDTLVSSLRWTCSAGESQLWDRVDEFFDTPRHALFFVNLFTNQRNRPYATSQSTSDAGRKLLHLLQDHPALFNHGADSEALVMALMRTSLYMGDPAAALKYAGAAPASGALPQDPEFNWMTAIAHFVLRDYSRAEAPLLRMLHARPATSADRLTAAQGLVGVYFKTRRPVEALHAAFVQESEPLENEQWPERGSLPPRAQWCYYGQNLDLAYLLDAALSEDNLREYLRKYPRPVGPPLLVGDYSHRRSFSAPQIVRYTLAVRLARREAYEEAAKFYEDAGAAVRARRMHDLAALLQRTRNTNLSPAERPAALFEYGEYIALNPERLYFNDLLWVGFQRSVFLKQGDDRPWYQSPRMQPGLTRREREKALADDRRLRDEQEERWKAFHIFEQVVRESGDPELHRKAAQAIVDCLSRINTDRFGRRREIQTAITSWKKQGGGQ